MKKTLNKINKNLKNQHNNNNNNKNNNNIQKKTNKIKHIQTNTIYITNIKTIKSHPNIPQVLVLCLRPVVDESVPVAALAAYHRP